MIFSYYFDTKKSHLLNFKFNVLQFIELEKGVNEIMFSAEVEEVRNGGVKRREVATGTFQFPPSENEEEHDIDFTRVRYANQNKWIFTIRNNKLVNQSVTIGLISETANRNPLGMDVYHNSEEYNAILKGNNLSILEASYKPPILKQTLVNNTFSQPGYPERFSSITAKYSDKYKLFELSEFIQGFVEPIPVMVPFKISLDIAPKQTEPNFGFHVFHLVIPNLGRVSLLTNGLEYMIDGGNPSDVQRTFFGQTVQPEDFWENERMTSKARLTIEGDGNGKLTIRYYDTVLTGIYDPMRTFDHMTFQTEYAKVDNVEGGYNE